MLSLIFFLAAGGLAGFLLMKWGVIFHNAHKSERPYHLGYLVGSAAIYILLCALFYMVLIAPFEPMMR